MHTFFYAIRIFLRLLMKVVMLLTKEKTNYLMVPQDVMSYITVDRICLLGHIIPSLAISILIGVKLIPEIWPYYANELNKNGVIVSIIIAFLFITVAIINGIIIEKILSKVNSKYFSYKKSLEAQID